VLNFQVDRFSTFRYTWTYIFRHFGSNCLFLQNLAFWAKIWHFGGNWRSHVKIQYSNPNKAHPCMIVHQKPFRHLTCMLVREKIKSLTKKLYFSLLLRRIFTKFGSMTCLA